jgi:nicotinate dehydrogenase subunit A
MPAYTFRVNGREVTANSWDAEQPLLYMLRNGMGLHGAKFGWGVGQCGYCRCWSESPCRFLESMMRAAK